MGRRFALIAVGLCIGGCVSTEAPLQPAAVYEPSAIVTAEVPQGETSEQAVAPPVVQENQPPATSPKKTERPERSSTKAHPPQPLISDAKLISYILQQSRARYSGNCACPDDRDRAGRRCGARSAYSKPGGASPLCYARDVTPAMIEAARRELTTSQREIGRQL